MALSFCLSGEALCVLSRTPSTECADYDKLRQALLHDGRLLLQGPALVSATRLRTNPLNQLPQRRLSPLEVVS